jgi:predicted MFS family arabinose efflux permease
MPFVLIVGTLYVSFHHFVRYRYTRTLLYPVLSWQHRLAPLILVALLLAIGGFFVVGSLVSETLRDTTLGPSAVLLVSLAIMLLRDPTPK